MVTRKRKVSEELWKGEIVNIEMGESYILPLVTISRLFNDIRFIARVKQEFIEAELDAGMLEEFREADRLFKEEI